jgi:hypothetical protein
VVEGARLESVCVGQLAPRVRIPLSPPNVIIFILRLFLLGHTMDMSPYILALRAITATVFQRVYRPVVWVVSALLVVIFVIVVLLAAIYSPWWLVALLIIIPLGLVFTLIATVLWIASKKLLPRSIDRTEHKQITEFSDKIMRVVEVRATPFPVMAAFIAKDIVRGKKSSYIEGIIDDSKTLKSDFTAIKALFE